MMKKLLIFFPVFILTFLVSCSKDDPAIIEVPDQPDVPEGYSLIWSDEFNDSDINTSNWNFETGDGTDYGLPAGWGNDEKQIYTTSNENAGIEMNDGISALAITALENNIEGYTSAKLTTKNLHSTRFGRIEVRSKMPQGQGLWPAIWLLGDNIDQVSWPGCGEIDISEVLGHQTTQLNTTLHYTTGDHEHGEVQNIYTLTEGTFSDAYHTYTLEWTPESLTMVLDGEQIGQFLIESDMKEFLRSFYLVLNVAVGGNLPGDPDATTVFPQTMYIDYVRVYSKDDMEIPEAPVLDIEEETVGQVIEPGIGSHAIKTGFEVLGSLTVTTYGPGEPAISTSEISIDGDSSLVFAYPGTSWGGAYLLLDAPVDMSDYSHIKFSLNKPENLANAEIKLESTATNAAIFLENYTGTALTDGFVEYTIPLSDFDGLELSELIIPFSIWNPQDADLGYVEGSVLIDMIYFTN